MKFKCDHLSFVSSIVQNLLLKGDKHVNYYVRLKDVQVGCPLFCIFYVLCFFLSFLYSLTFSILND
jgi:hypothetical protein